MRKRRHEETRDSTVSKIVLLVGMSIRSRVSALVQKEEASVGKLKAQQNVGKD